MKAVFLDRDGVLNVEKGRYVYRISDFELVPGIVEVLQAYKKAGFLCIVITNQGGIAKGIYSIEDMSKCHDHFQEISGNLIDAFYYAPDHPDFSESLSRKPDSLLFEKAIAKFDIDPTLSWMIGNQERDLIPAKKLGIQTIMFQGPETALADYTTDQVNDLKSIILGAS